MQYECNSVGPEYFRTFAIPVLRGREFSVRDRKASQPVVVVNESFARKVFGSADPVGHTIATDFSKDKPRLIVGVVKDSKYGTFSEKQLLAVYEPYFASDEPVNLHFVIRVAGSAAAYVKSITDLLAVWIPRRPLRQSR